MYYLIKEIKTCNFVMQAYCREYTHKVSEWNSRNYFMENLLFVPAKDFL